MKKELFLKNATCEIFVMMNILVYFVMLGNTSMPKISPLDVNWNIITFAQKKIIPFKITTFPEEKKKAKNQYFVCISQKQAEKCR